MLPARKVVVRLLAEGTVQESLQAAGSLTEMNNLMRPESAEVSSYSDGHRLCGVLSIQNCRSVVDPLLD